MKTFGSVFKLSRPDIPGGFFSNARRIFIFFHVCLLLIDQLALGGGLAIDIREIGFDADSVGVHAGSLLLIAIHYLLLTI
ncbi:hypothetical protein [Collinsella tanakaei]|uniref:hypothetical protein n=1 Tax=Collinsella tanakaei TaxID=626935 RepID=UPI00248EB18C|nr:hypothetical protein [Collinsella tanakaei]